MAETKSRKKSETCFSDIKLATLHKRDILSVSAGWKVNKRRYLSFKKACETQKLTMREVSNVLLDGYIRDIFGEEYLQKMYEAIKADNEELKAKRQHKPYVPTAKEWF